MMINISRKMIWAVLFAAAAAAGAFILIWLLKPGAEVTGHQAEDPVEMAAAEDSISIKEDRQDEPQKEVPRGMKEVNLPISFFGDHAVLDEGDRVDIIATYYNEDAGKLCSERIITASEIIRLENGRSIEIDDSLTLGDALISNSISGTGTAIDMGNILVLTFFLTDDEVLRSFTALESGMLYIALCPDPGLSEWGDG